MIQDLRYALRALGRTPGFTLAAGATLALGIGANTAMFIVVNAVLLHPLPYADPERLVRFEEGRPGYRLNISYPNFLDWRSRSRSFEELAIFNPMGRTTIADGDRPEVVPSGIAEARLFRVLGVDPVAGRLFAPDEHQPGAVRVALLSHRLWQRRYGGDPTVVDRAIDIGGPHAPYPAGQEPSAVTACVTPAYFDVMGIPLRRGRALSPDDRPGVPTAIVVNEAFVRQFFADRDPLGGTVSAPAIPDLGVMRIVGVVGDTRRGGLTGGFHPELYCAYA